MPEPQPSLITAVQTASMAGWLGRLASTSRLRGAHLARSGAVLRTWWTVPGAEMRALVRGSRLYQLTLSLAPEGIVSVTCSCPFGWGCKHAAALLLSVLDGSEVDGDDSDLVRPPFLAVVPAAPPAAPTGLAEEIRGIIGKPLGKGDTAIVGRIAELFASGEATITERALFALAGYAWYTHSFTDAPVTLWSAQHPPASGLEAWLYVAHALRARKRLPNSALFNKVPWAQVDALVAPWLREQEIARWKQRLVDISRGATSQRSPRFRLRLVRAGAALEVQSVEAGPFAEPKKLLFRQQMQAANSAAYRPPDPHLDENAIRFLLLVHSTNARLSMPLSDASLPRLLDRLLRLPGFEESVVNADGQPLRRSPLALRWQWTGPHSPAGSDPLESGDYEFGLRLPDGSEPQPALLVLPGDPSLYVTSECVHAFGGGGLVAPGSSATRVSVPVAALESNEGVSALDRLGLPAPGRLADRLVTVTAGVTVRARLWRQTDSPTDQFQLQARASFGPHFPPEQWDGETWIPAGQPMTPPSPGPGDPVIRLDRSPQKAALGWLNAIGPQTKFGGAWSQELWLERRLPPVALRQFPEEFLAWLERRPEGLTVELDPELASLRDGQVSGFVGLEAEESGLDWFDLRVVLKVSDLQLNKTEIAALLAAPGRWVRLPGKGWRKLEFQLTEDEQKQLADLGLGTTDLAGGEPQRLHVLQLAGAGASRLLPEAQIAEVKRRAAELKTEVRPQQPGTITAELRPYQRDGFHFLAYLSTNRFGGILADDMGLGKTLQALTWLAWLRAQGHLKAPVLVVCPKSVQDNWRAEAARFYPTLPVRVWTREEAGILKLGGKPQLLIVNYAQLRLHENILQAQKWAVVILDEAQFIKNPTSATAKAACGLKAAYRLALSGTPIENRLLDLWSIMAFAMPGVLGNKAAFVRNFGAKDDPLARRRLAARVRPFLLRRTKQEVAKDLPARTEEDLTCELEGPQATLYQAELKRARALLLGAKTARQLDSMRFHVLSSLLRLRQICCHPSLIGGGSPEDDCAKLDALFDLLEPLVEEGHKVLVFSQFVEMLELIRQRLAARGWAHLLLTGQTEERGPLVADFQARTDACIFLISLKAGGFGLNLTAASYVVLFDPWWNPAVENQAIDRTHRIGQTNPVIAYRLLVRGTIEEKIRHLQRQKSALAADILGEETFAKALTLDDFRFLLE